MGIGRGNFRCVWREMAGVSMQGGYDGYMHEGDQYQCMFGHARSRVLGMYRSARAPALLAHDRSGKIASKFYHMVHMPEIYFLS